MALDSSDVNAGDDILATHHNLLIDDIEQHTHDGTDTAKVDFTANPETRYYTVCASDFLPYINTQTWELGGGTIEGWRLNANSLNAGSFFTGVHLPNGSIITSFKVYWYRNDAVATAQCRLYRNDMISDAATTMADADSNSSAGFHQVEDTTIASATIDNSAYQYFVKVTMNANDNWYDVSFYGIVIAYTVVLPLP